MSERFLADLERLYADLEAALPSHSGNPCGACRECCTARELNVHHVTGLELDYIRRHVGEARAEAFRRYAARDADAPETCPFYDEATSGCGIYRWRPFSCRIFGHFRAEGTHLPAPCVFRGHETVYPPRDYVRRIPLAATLRGLVREHLLHRSGDPAFDARSGRGGAGGDPQGEPDDPLDRAARMQARGDCEGALRELLAERSRQGDSAFLLYALGIVYEDLQREAEALPVFEAALALAPEAAALYYHRGYVRLALGDLAGAVGDFERTVARNERHVLALGLLGFLALAQGRLEEGAGWLERAVAIAPDNGPFRCRLALAWLSLGRHEEAVVQLRAAAGIEASREEALRLLGSLRATP